MSHSTSFRVSITQRSIILLENNVSAVSHHSESITLVFSLIFSHSERLFSPSLIQRASSESHSHRASLRVSLFSEFICSQSASLRVPHSECCVTPKVSHSVFYQSTFSFRVPLVYKSQKLMLDATWLCNEQKVDQRGLLERESHTRGRAPENFVTALRRTVRKSRFTGGPSVRWQVQRTTCWIRLVVEEGGGPSVDFSPSQSKDLRLLLRIVELSRQVE